jgi:hypothetical protein
MLPAWAVALKEIQHVAVDAQRHHFLDARKRGRRRRGRLDGLASTTERRFSKASLRFASRDRFWPVGPSGPRRPAPPSLLGGASSHISGATRRENASGCLTFESGWQHACASTCPRATKSPAKRPGFGSA